MANETYYLSSILRHLQQFRTWALEETETITLGTEALSDNIDWLDCFIEDGRFSEIVNAYTAGATDVHNNRQEDRDPDFSEAARDYAREAVSA